MVNFTINYKTKLLFVVSYVILFTAVDSSAQTENVIATRQDTVVSIKGTNFYLRDMMLVKGDRNAIFKAKVTHNGRYDWSNMSIYLTLLDSEGNIVKDQYSERGEHLINVYPLDADKIVKVEEQLPGESNRAESFKYRIGKTDYPIRNVVNLVEPENSQNRAYSDSLIKIAFRFKSDRIRFSVKNKSQKPLKIRWNEVSYIDSDNESHRVMHGGVKYADRNESQPPTLVPPTAKHSDEIIPNPNVSYSELSNEWNVDALFPNLYPAANSNKGKRFSIFMPIYLDDTSRDYFFTFEIVGFERVR
jgi:hypothetical protein